MTTRSREKPISHHLEVILEEGAYEHGYRIQMGLAAGWLFRQSATAPGEIALAANSVDGPFFLSTAHKGIAKDVAFERTEPCAKGHEAAFIFEDRDSLFAAIGEVYRKSRSIPTQPLERFKNETSTLGDTETDRQTKVRVGQNIFRESLSVYWNGRCPMTGISDPELLIASHIISWSKCESDAERLNVYNGILLSSLWDAAFDKGLISFDDEGVVLVAPDLSRNAREALAIGNAPPLPVTEEHKPRLAWHRKHFGFEA